MLNPNIYRIMIVSPSCVREVPRRECWPEAPETRQSLNSKPSRIGIGEYGDTQGCSPRAIGYRARARPVTNKSRLALAYVNLLGFTAVSPLVSTGMIVPAIGSYAARKATAAFTTMTRNCWQFAIRLAN